MRRILHLQLNTPALVRGYAISLVSLCLVILSVGCSDNDTGPLAPSMAEIQAPSDSADIVDDGGSMDSGGGSRKGNAGGGSDGTDVRLMSVSGEYTPGRMLNLAFSSKVKLKVGVDAYHETIVITGDLYETTTGGKVEELEFEFGPSITFHEAVKLEINYSYIKHLEETGGTFTLWRYHEDSCQWRVEEVALVGRGGKIRFSINHFSKYAIGR